MGKEDLKNILINMETKENKDKVEHLLSSLDKISDEDLKAIIDQINTSGSSIEEFIENKITNAGEQEEKSEDFIKVNDWFSYGRTGDTIHMHLVPTDLRGVKAELGDEAFYSLYSAQLEDFLSKMQALFLEDDSIKTMFAVSPIFYNPNISLIHEDLGFDQITEVDLNNEKDAMSKEQKEFFLNMFNKGENNRKVYYTKMTREKMLEGKYKQINDDSSPKKI